MKEARLKVPAGFIAAAGRLLWLKRRDCIAWLMSESVLSSCVHPFDLVFCNAYFFVMKEQPLLFLHLLNRLFSLHFHYSHTLLSGVDCYGKV